MPGSEATWVGSSVTALRDGRILAAGGSVYSWDEQTETESWEALAKAEIYDPKTGTSRPTGNLRIARIAPTATLLRDGRVLVTGGDISESDGMSLASAEIYDPKTGAFRATGRMRTARHASTETLLRDGRVLITGGSTAWNAPVLASAEIYDPKTGRFSATGKLRTARYRHTATLLRDGRVLITGGSDYVGEPHEVPTTLAEIYDPRTGRFSPTGSMTRIRAGYAATLLRDGRVLISGGIDPGEEGVFNPPEKGPEALASAEIFDPKTGTFSPAEP